MQPRDDEVVKRALARAAQTLPIAAVSPPSSVVFELVARLLASSAAMPRTRARLTLLSMSLHDYALLDRSLWDDAVLHYELQELAELYTSHRCNSDIYVRRVFVEDSSVLSDGADDEDASAYMDAHMPVATQLSQAFVDYKRASSRSTSY